MVSDTKLNDEQKQYLKYYRKNQPGVKVITDGKVTMAYREFKNTVEFSLAVSSDNEKKFRPKVGEYYARQRLDEYLKVKLDTDNFFRMLDTVFYNAI